MAELEEENQDLKNKNMYLNEEVEELKKQNEKMKKKITKISTNFELAYMSMQQIKSLTSKMDITSSKILTKDAHIKFIQEEVATNKSLHLLYRANRDGFEITNYWPKVKGRSKLIHLIQAQGGKIFGGYQSVATDTSTYQ